MTRSFAIVRRMPPKSTYTEAVADRICELVGNGIPLAQVLREEPGMPKLTTVYDWQREHKPFAERFVRARIAGYDMIAADLLRIADDASNDYMEKEVADGTVTVFNAEHVQRSKLRIETRLRLLAKWDPKRYGERIEVAGDPEAPIGITDRNERDIARRIALALALGLQAPREKVIEGESTTLREPIAHSAQDDIDDLL